MISRIDDPLQIDSDCRQASCHFDKDLYQEEIQRQFNIILPQTLDCAVQKRKAEFIAGRYCARQALAQLDGNFHSPIGIGANREPLWPEGFVGSITHTHGYASAVAASRTKVRAVGIDSETWVEPGIAHDVGGKILTTRENYDAHRHLFESPQHYLTLVFSAKESLYKCLFPLVNKFFGFHSAAIILQHSASTANGQFRFELLENLNDEFCRGYSGHGRYSMHENFVHTAVVLKP